MTNNERVLVEALEDALEGLADILPYVPQYFVDKWDLASYATRAMATLKGFPHDGPADA